MPLQYVGFSFLFVLCLDAPLCRAWYFYTDVDSNVPCHLAQNNLTHGFMSTEYSV